MKKLYVFIVTVFLFAFSIKPLYADEAYNVLNFLSEVDILEDTSLQVKETILVDFKLARHGIYRIIPVEYTYRGRSINSRLKITEISDEKGNKYKYESKRTGQSLSLKIGDPDTEIVGLNTYIIKYSVKNILQQYGENYELYWNVTGHEWDSPILSARAIVRTPYAQIQNLKCFSGNFGSVDKGCKIEGKEDQAEYVTLSPITYGDDFTVVAGFSAANTFTPPGKLERIMEVILSNWGYLVSPLPLYLIFYFWYKRGRDKKYSGANIYYKEDTAIEETKGLFSREHLPFVYHPIKDLTPSEVGVLVDEKVDIEDVLSEIMELARLGFIEIRKIVKKKLLKDEVEYAFVKLPKFDNQSERDKLRNYQEYLLNEIFRSTIIHKSIEVAEKFFKGNEKELGEARKKLIDKDYVLLGGLKNHFYEGLPVFKEKLYKRMEEEEYFYENPEKVRGKWIGGYIALSMVSLFLLAEFGELTNNYGPMVALILISLPGAFIANAMPRRTPRGYSLKRQIEGLSWYLEKGKWRYEVQEKNLFIEEVLPLAIALGVVDVIAKEMSDIGIKPPKYMPGFSGATFGSDLSTFKTSSTNSIFSTPGGKWSGSSSWSGGSGFSGGSSGGGFGGGGGGSW